MILRIRLPSGATERVTLSTGEGLTHLGQKINELHKLEGQFSLYSDPKFTQPFVFETAKHGDIIFIQGTLIPSSSATTNATNDEANSESPNTATKTGLRCRHGPHGMCEHCMPKEDKRERAAAELKKMGKKGSSIAVLEALEALKFRVSPQENAHVSSALINNEAANSFQSYLGDTGYSHQRVGYCFGQIDKISETNENNNSQKNKISSNISEQSEKLTTSIHVIYEPPQKGNEDTYSLIDNDDDDDNNDITKRSHIIAKLLDFKFLGIVISTRPRKCMLSAKDIVFSCGLISKLDKELRKSFIIFIVSISENNEISFEAFQISDLAIEMYESNIFEDATKQKPNGSRILCKENVLIEGKDTKKIPTEFFMLNIPIKPLTDCWLSTKFPIENRDIAPQNATHLQSIISNSNSNNVLPLYQKLSDFHVLLFLSNVFDIDNDMPRICNAIKEKQEIDEGYRLMIENMASS